MAGETYEARDPLIMIPKDIRNIVVRILEQYISDQQLGGGEFRMFLTQMIRFSIQISQFFEDTIRKSQHLLSSPCFQHQSSKSSVRP